MRRSVDRATKALHVGSSTQPKPRYAGTVNPALFELLESYYRPKRQLRAIFMVAALLLFALLMCMAASMWIFGVDEVPSYVCSSGDRD